MVSVGFGVRLGFILGTKFEEYPPPHAPNLLLKVYLLELSDKQANEYHTSTTTNQALN